MNKKNVLTALLCLSAVTASAQKLSISKTTIDCGRTAFQVPVTAEFEIRNKGLRHLTISEVKTDCGCTAVELPKKSLAPGEKFTLRMTYDGRLLGHYDKSAIIYSNGSKKPLRLRMKGVVLAEMMDYADAYPYTLGELLADRDHVEFDDVNKGDTPEQVIRIMNNSSHRMQPNILHLPPYLTALATPETLEPGRAGKLTLTLNSGKVNNFGLTQTTVYLAGNLGDKVKQDNELPVSVVLLPDKKTFEGTARQYAPHMELSSDHLNLGMVDGKKVKQGVITITNSGRTALSIRSLQMFTRGLKLTLDSRELQPGQQARLKIVGDRSQLLKARQKPRVLMITNDPDHAKVVITINVK
jgi:hypothetical protein